MKPLFCWRTDRFHLEWCRVSDRDPAVVKDRDVPIAHCTIVTHDRSLQWLEPSEPESVLGVRLYEQTEYQLYVRALQPGDTIEVRHRDPQIVQGLRAQEAGQVVHGNLNFRGQIGRSRFAIVLNGQTVVEFEVEVFPTKIDYESDYQAILADVQRISTSLAYEYLRATYQLGKVAVGERPSRLEWFVLLEAVVDELERAIQYVAAKPMRGLVRREQVVRVEKVRRVDAAVRAQIRRGQGRGGWLPLADGVVREHVRQRPATLTLDTNEHRWLAAQLRMVARTLASIVVAHSTAETRASVWGRGEGGVRQRQAVEALGRMQRRVTRWLGTAPMVAAAGDPPAGFVSLQLTCAPGYREAYRLLLLLRSGLRLEGDWLQLSCKDLEVLYEYWAYLTLVETLRGEFGPPVRLDSLFRTESARLSVRLRAGQQQVTFAAGQSRKIHVAYNPWFKNQESMLIPQKPDLLVRLEEDGWPVLQLVADAKYRVDASADYVRQFGSPGPPAESLNSLHRYRDAIVELDQAAGRGLTPQRSVVQAVALFPLGVESSDAFRQGRLWQALNRLGVGAIPLLPGNRQWLAEWLLATVRLGGWALSDRGIVHAGAQRAVEWRQAAHAPAWIGVLRSPGTDEHWEWLQQSHCYYLPWAKTQPRQFAVQQIAIYFPARLGDKSRIEYVADVQQIELVERESIETPWPARREGTMVLYRLGAWRRLPRPIRWQVGDVMPAGGRWTTRLALSRATRVQEVALETEAEWRLWEWLRARGVAFQLRATAVRGGQGQGRVWFELGALRVRWDGVSGFLLRRVGLEDRYVGWEDVQRVVG